MAFIIADEMCNSFLLTIFSDQVRVVQYVFFVSLLILQIISATVQSTISDLHSRKTSIIISLTFSCLSLILGYIYVKKIFSPVLVLSLSLFIKGALGNTLPLAWAGLADIRTKNFRYAIGLACLAMALGYFAYILVTKNFNKEYSTLIFIGIYFILILSCILSFKDIRESEPEGYTHRFALRELSEIIKMLMTRRFFLVYTVFLLWEVSFYSAHMLDVEMKLKDFTHLTISMIIGYILGVIFLKYSKKSNQKLIKRGYYITILSVTPVFLIAPSLNHISYILLPAYFMYSLASAFMTPPIFSILSKISRGNDQGKIYGLFDSTDSLAFLLASISVIIYEFLQLKPIYIVAFSYLIFLISAIPYLKFKKTLESED